MKSIYCSKRAIARDGSEHTCKLLRNHKGKCLCSCKTKFIPKFKAKSGIVRITALVI